MRINRSYQDVDITQYPKTLLLCQGKKTCTNLARETNASHDSIYRELDISTESREEVRNTLKAMVESYLPLDELYLVYDDTLLCKQFAREIEGLETSFDGSSKRPVQGLRIMTAMLTDGNIRIPIDTESYTSKTLAGASYKSKSDIAIAITTDLIKTLRVKRIIADAHFSTKQSIKFFSANNLSYLMKIACNRVVTIGDKMGQLKKIFRLRKNERMRSAKGFFDGVPCYFYVVKIKDGTIVYFISNDQIEHNKVIELYRIRWNIEIFHRVAKQSLGLGDCQARSIEKQLHHCLYVMQAFAFADIVRVKMKQGCVEDAIRWLRGLKPARWTFSNLALGQNLC